MNTFNIFKTILKVEFKYYFNSKIAFIGYAIGVFLNLLVYYFTSKAILPHQNFSGSLFKQGYFEYIVIGEIILLLTQASLTQGQDLIIRLKNNGILEQIYFSKLGILKSFLIYYLVLVLNNFIHVLLSLVISKLIFNLSLDFGTIIKLIVAMFIGSLFFVGIYLLNVFITLIYKRKNNSLQHLVNLAGFFSGAYFPLEVVGNQSVIKFLAISPITSLVAWIRGLIYDHNWFSNNLFILIVWLLVPTMIASIFYAYYIKKKHGYFYVN